METYVLYFNEIDKSSLPNVGGKGANLGEMTKAGFHVPDGFCVTTWAYRTFINTSNDMNKLFDLLERVSHNNLEQIKILGQQIRKQIEDIIMPDDIKSSILEAWRVTGEEKAYAVRSSATAEDLPTASFAGQQDTFLNVRGQDQLLKTVQNCWASLFTDRAILYRAKNGFNHRCVFLSVVVQQMVFPEVSGIMFTADPVTGRRKTVSIDASFGLGEALVSGLVTADLYQVRSGEILKKQISKKKIAIYSVPEGGTLTKDLPPEEQELQALPNDRIIQLAKLGQKIEAYYGSEQDIEWGLVDAEFYILQSRPITSLYPLPNVSDDKLHVFLSLGHQQMMTDAMKPLAISLFQNLLKFLNKKSAPSKNNIILEVGGRVYADLTGPLSLKSVQKKFLRVINSMDELMASAISQVIERVEFRNSTTSKMEFFRIIGKIGPIIIPIGLKVISNLLIKDPSKAKTQVELIMERIVTENEETIFGALGTDKLRRIQNSMETMIPNVLAKIVVFLITGVLAANSLENRLKKRMGDKRTAYLLSQLNKSLPGNITTELGLKLGDLADTIRKSPEVIDYLIKADQKTFYEELLKVRGGVEFTRELEVFLKQYGMRCSGEIDITKPRWNEDPTQLVSSIISNIHTSAAGERREHFKQGEAEAEHAAKEILSQFGLIEGRRISRLIKLYRNLMGMREHHKFILVKLLDIYKRAILEEAHRFTKKGILSQEHDVFYFTLEELITLEENRSHNIIEFIKARKKQFERNQKLTPPRVMTSEGEIITGKLRDIQAPNGALVGTPVSAGTVEGIARVVLRLEEAKLNPGEILVAPYTDPGWTPLFNSAIGLITEIGGMMTHGSVIAREYGIPAVVGIDKATEIIKDGSYIRVNGTEGYVELLGDIVRRP
ncbi:MAG: phosphoenolpyruvate synthase [Desulfosporosinus sp.]|nr:phosphoenolpyruvate synthase [Desulfosporosinus sp.]